MPKNMRPLRRASRGASCPLVYSVSALLCVGLLAAACGDSPSEPPPPPPPPPPPAYHIQIRYVPGTDPPADVRQRLEDAAARWERVITGDLPAAQVTEPTSQPCEMVTIPPMDEEVDDLVVWVEIGPLDGQGGIGGFAGVCVTRANHLPVVSSILFDEADYLYPTLAAHEFGHAVGIGEVWDEMGLLADPVKPEHGGPGELEAVADATIASGSPDENFGLPGPSPLTKNLVVGKNLGDWTAGPDDEELRALVRWDLSGIQLSAPITEARILLSESSSRVLTAGAQLQIDFARGGWAESTVTWTNQPPSMGPYTPANVAGITGEVQAWLDGTELNQGVLLGLYEFNTTDAYFAYHTRHDADAALRPKLVIIPDAHFTGAHAIAQFDALGGAAYPAPKVPVENDVFDWGQSVDGHWRSFYLTDELMNASLGPGAKLSAITIGALEDMGYEVDYTEADPFAVNHVSP